MESESSDLPGYEEVVRSLADKLGGLTTVHDGLGEAAQSLVVAHRELEVATRRLEALSGSAQGTLDEVRRLRPAELTAALEASLASFSRESSESLDALGQRLLAIGNETTTMRQQADARFGSIERHLAAQDDALPDRLSAITTATTASVTTSQQATDDAVSVLREQLEAVAEAITVVQRRQVDLAQRHDALLPRLDELRRQHADLAREVGHVRGSVEATEAGVLGMRQAVDRLGPATTEAINRARGEFAGEISLARWLQIGSLTVVLVALALAWASLAGIVPVPAR